MTRTYSIGAVARATGLTQRALRHYETVGLVEVGRDAQRRRTYDVEAQERLGLIRVLREVGISIPEIRALAQRARSAKALARLAAPCVTARLADLRARVRHAEGLLEEIGRLAAAGEIQAAE